MTFSDLESDTWDNLIDPRTRFWFDACRGLHANWDPNELAKAEKLIALKFRPGIDGLDQFKTPAKFHLACVKVLRRASRMGGEPSQRNLRRLDSGGGFSFGTARALCRELSGHRRGRVLAHSVTPALLVPVVAGDGVVMDLHLELIEEDHDGGGHLYAAPEMLFVKRADDFDQAITDAVAWVKDHVDWPADADIRWRLVRQYSDDPWFRSYSGNSAGGAFLFGLLQLLAQAERIPGDDVYCAIRDLNFHPHALRGVVWMCTVTAGGQLAKIGEEPKKFRGIRERSRPRIHSVVGAPEQKSEIQGALSPANQVDGIRYFLDTPDPLIAVRQVVHEVKRKWEGIFDYRSDWERHRDRTPRPWMEEDFAAYLADRAQGNGSDWFLLDAHARFGKSAFAARVFGPESAEVAGHFFWAEGGRDDAEKAVRSIVLQLCLIHRLEIPDLSDLPRAADRAFTQAAGIARGRGEVQLVVLDGLDRCADFAALESLLPGSPPAGLAFLATTHPWMPLGKLANPGCCVRANLPDRATLVAEVREYLQSRRREFEPPLGDELLDRIAAGSQGLIGVAREVLAHPKFADWRQQPEQLPDGPGTWQGDLWPAGSPLQKIEDYRRDLIHLTGTVQPLGFRDHLPISGAYVPMTTAPPVSADMHAARETVAEAGQPDRAPVAFRGMFAYLAERFPRDLQAIQIAGEPGSGKTTASQQLAWFLAHREPVVGLPEEMIPVWLRFQKIEWIKDKRLKRDGVETDILDLPDLLKCDTDAAPALLDCRQPLLWILDGFDEIPTEGLQGRVAGWILALAGSPKRRTKGDRLLVTSRPLGEDKTQQLGLNQLASFDLRPLDDEGQREFIENYLRLNGQAAWETGAGELGEIIAIRERHSGEERRMARNPMLLSLICFLFAEGNLPEDWDDLHDRFVDELFDRGIQRLRQENAVYGNWDPSGFDGAVAKALLSHLAWWMQEQDDRVSQPEDALNGGPCLADEVERFLVTLKPRHRKAIPDQSLECLRLMREHIGLMCWRGVEAAQLGFLHLNIQESLAATHCAASHGEEHNLGAKLAKLFGENPDAQREVVRLAVKQSKRAAPSFHHELFLGLLSDDVRADEHHDVFLSRLVELAGAS